MLVLREFYSCQCNSKSLAYLVIAGCEVDPFCGVVIVGVVEEAGEVIRVKGT